MIIVLYQIITFIIVIPLLTTNTYDVEGKGKMSLIQVLSNDICSNKSEIPVQIKCNACILLCKMVETVRSGMFEWTMRDGVYTNHFIEKKST